ncbi:MAG: hypothetical protein QM594_00985 [Niabella sp.]
MSKDFTIYGQLAQLERNNEFKDKFKALYEESLLNNFETGWILYPSVSSTFRYEKVSGQPNNASVHFEPSSSVDGFIHCHYKNLYPTFSGSDIRAVYDAWDNEQIYDPQTFLSGVVSASGNAYLLKITDLSAFIGFANANLSAAAAFRSFEYGYHNKQQAWLATHNNEVLSFEQALLDMLAHSGLVMFKSNTNFNSWHRMEKLPDGKIVLLNCNE